MFLDWHFKGEVTSFFEWVGAILVIGAAVIFAPFVWDSLTNKGGKK